MTHLTFTGYEAGRPLCGCNRQEEREKGNDFAHAIYFPVSKSGLREQVCPECLKIWESAEEE